MAQKPSTPKGTRDFSPDEMMRRNFIFDTIRSVFKKYGYQPIETPAMENLETLMGKYGEEGDKLIFKILNSGNFTSEVAPPEIDWTEYKEVDGIAKKIKLTPEESKILVEGLYEIFKSVMDREGLIDGDAKDLVTEISEKALRYDLTVPFARYVVQHQNEISFPFKRYQIQPVWRADRPQKGRYREFFQCDADVIGSASLINEVELVQIIDEAFIRFAVPVIIRISNRKVIAGIAEYAGVPERIVEVAVTLDKYDKIGDEIFEEFADRGFSPNSIDKLKHFVSVANDCVDKFKAGDSNYTFEKLNELFVDIEIGRMGSSEVQQIFNHLARIADGGRRPNLVFSLILARGLNYYTGAIFEVEVDRSKSNSTFTSSICGGGRYDDLTGIFGLPNMSGVGISFGIDRIFDVLNEVGYPEDVTAKEGTRVLFANFGGEDEKHSLKLLKQVRDAGVAAEIYLDPVKMGKQFKYADDKKIPFVAIVGENERSMNTITLKNMQSGEQQVLNFNDVLKILTT